jgi:hypothetical protein
MVTLELPIFCPDMQPIENYNEWRMIYFISFLLLVGFFVLNMFVGVVVDNFHKCKEALEAEMREKARQKRIQRRIKRQQFAEIEPERSRRPKAVKSLPYWKKYGRSRLFVHGVVVSKYFDLAIAAVIGVNVVSMAMEFYMMPNGLSASLAHKILYFIHLHRISAARPQLPVHRRLHAGGCHEVVRAGPAPVLRRALEPAGHVHCGALHRGHSLRGVRGPRVAHQPDHHSRDASTSHCQRWVQGHIFSNT